MKKMRNKRWLFILIIILFIGILLYVFFYILPCFSHEPGISVKARLVVNGEQMEEKCDIYQHGKTGPLQSSIPILAVLDGLGNTVIVREDDSSVVIKTETEEYLMTEFKLYRDGELVLELPGIRASLLEYEGRSGEIYMEGEELLQVLDKMGITDISIFLDPKGREVSVSQRSTR